MKHQLLLKSYFKIFKKKFKKNLRKNMNKGKNSENSFNTKNQEFGLITCHFKNLISPKPIWNCQRSRICSRKLTRCITAHSSAHISDFFFKFLKKCFKHGHGNLVQITSTAQVELSKLNFNFDDIRIYFLQVLRDFRQITFVTLNGFCLLNKTNLPPCS